MIAAGFLVWANVEGEGAVGTFYVDGEEFEHGDTAYGWPVVALSSWESLATEFPMSERIMWHSSPTTESASFEVVLATRSCLHIAHLFPECPHKIFLVLSEIPIFALGV